MKLTIFYKNNFNEIVNKVYEFDSAKNVVISESHEHHYEAWETDKVTGIRIKRIIIPYLHTIEIKEEW